jgi:hypothetical protein
MIELSARTGLGQGLLPMSVKEVKNIKIINPEILESLPSISREIGSLNHELMQKDRLELDSKIFDAIGLTQEERKELYEAYIVLVTNRLGKATNIT